MVISPVPFLTLPESHAASAHDPVGPQAVPGK